MTRLLLILCQANIVRSPAAELLAADMIGATSVWSVRSAGTNALRDQLVDRDIADALRRRTIAVCGHRARQATVADVRGADLILTFERAQRDWVLRHHPAAHRMTFTIRRAAQILRSYDLDSMLAQGSDRAYAPEDDFEDPRGKGLAAADAAVEEIDELLRVVLPAIGASTGLRAKAEQRSTRRSASHVMVP